MESETSAARPADGETRPADGEALLVAEDDDEDFLLTQEAFQQCGRGPKPIRVRDGDELLDYLLRRGKWSEPRLSPGPRLILLDLNMPRRDGRQSLRDMKSDPRLRRIPVVVLTTSAAPEDVALVYELGGNAYVKKPLEFDRFVEAICAVHSFWFETNQPPGAPGTGP